MDDDSLTLAVDIGGEDFDVSDFPRPRDKRDDVRKAGNALRGVIPLSSDAQEKERIAELFRVAYGWRNAHILPMDKMRRQIMGRMRAIKASGFTAARPKRMASIRKKLRKISVHLDKFDDLAGCRAVLDSMASIDDLTRECQNSLHKLRSMKDYITNPRSDGYRSRHLLFDYEGAPGEAEFTGLRVEVQLRTRLQHSWSTSIEALGLYRGEDMKGGEGNADWRRLFALMSAEFAEAECTPVFPEYSERGPRRREIRSLAKSLSATDTLESLRAATRYVGNYVYEPNKMYLIITSPDGLVEVTPVDNPKSGAARFASIEETIRSNEDGKTVTFVEAERVNNLTEAYPNYFGDVALFAHNLERICKGSAAVERFMLPQERVSPPPRDLIIDPRDLLPSHSAFLRDWTTRGKKR